MLTGWEWLRERMVRDELDADHLPRCRAVVLKLSGKKKWVFLYDCVALVMLERIESLDDALIREHTLRHEAPLAALRSAPPPPPAPAARGPVGPSQSTTSSLR